MTRIGARRHSAGRDSSPTRRQQRRRHSETRAVLLGAARRSRRRGSVSRHAARAVARMGAGGARPRPARHRPQRRMAADRTPPTAPSMPSRTRAPNQAAATQAQAVYGMPELHREQIAGAQLDRQPRLLRDLGHSGAASRWLPRGSSISKHGIVADAKSGVSGAGKAPTAKTHFMYAADNLSAYGVFAHRHTGEMLEQIGVASERNRLYAAPAADSARHSVHDLRALQEAADARERGAGLSRVFCRQPDGAALRKSAAADSVLGADQLRRHRISTRRRAASAPSSSVASTIC